MEEGERLIKRELANGKNCQVINDLTCELDLHLMQMCLSINVSVSVSVSISISISVVKGKNFSGHATRSLETLSFFA